MLAALIFVAVESWEELTQRFGANAAAIAAVLACLGLFHVKVIRPIVQAAKLFVKKWHDIDEQGEALKAIRADIKKIKEDIAPTNGDRRSISARLDTTKRDSKEALDIARQVKDDLQKRMTEENGQIEELRDGQREIRDKVVTTLTNLVEKR